MRVSPIVSIVLPSYNYAKYISQTIESVLIQSFTEWELIIVEDGSTDESLSLCESFQKKYPEKIRVISSSNNLGLPKTIATGVDQALGEYIAFLEADDSWERESLEQKLSAIRKYNCTLAFTDVMLVGQPSRWMKLVEKNVQTFTQCLPANKTLNMSWILTQNFIPTFSCVIARKADLEKVSFELESSMNNLDHWIWVQLSLMGNFVYLPHKLTLWRIHNESFGFKQTQDSLTIFTEKKIDYTRKLHRLMSRLIEERQTTIEQYLYSCRVERYQYQQIGIIEKILEYAESHRTNDKKSWRIIIFIKDWLWITFLR